MVPCLQVIKYFMVLLFMNLCLLKEAIIKDYLNSSVRFYHKAHWIQMRNIIFVPGGMSSSYSVSYSVSSADVSPTGGPCSGMGGMP